MSKAESAEQTYVLEPVDLDDADDVRLQYEELPKFAEDDPDNFDALFSAMQGDLTVEDAEAKQREPQLLETGYKPSSSQSKSSFEPSPEDMCVEDFVRNFLVAHKMQKTLEAFQIEWFELYHGKPPISSKSALPRIYQQYQDLLQEMDILKRTSAAAAAAAAEAKGTWAKFRHERDVHRLHHRRLVQEKNALVTDLKRLRRHVRQYQPALDELQKKYEQTTKELVLVRLEKTKLQQTLAALQAQYQQATGEVAPGTSNSATSPNVGPSVASIAASLRSFSKNRGEKQRTSEKLSSTTNLDRTARATSPSTSEAKDRPTNYSHLLPVEAKTDTSRSSKPISLTTAVMAHSFQGHKLGVSGVSISPTSPIFATTSDDMTWKLWSLPRGELIMTGKGSNSWFAGGAFHPSGSLFATAGADGHAKIWNLAEQRCVSQLSGHTQPLWDIKFHEGQHTVLTASSDHTARLWDIHTSQLLHTFRGHVDAVNRVQWVPHTATFVTASGDKTLSLWDARTGLCVQSFYGHNSAVRALDITPDSKFIASGDARGQIRLWDLSTGSELTLFETDSSSKLGTTGTVNFAAGVNSLSFDPSGRSFVASIDSGHLKVYQRETNDTGALLDEYVYGGEMQGQGAESIVQDLVISNNSDYAVAGTGDGQVLIWQL